MLFKKFPLAGVAWWVEWQPVNPEVAGSLPGQGTGLGCRPGTQVGACKRQLVDVSHIDVSLPLFLSPFPSL